VYWTTVPRRIIESGMQAFAESSDNPFAGIDNVDDLPFGSLDDEIAAEVDGREFAEAKFAAIRAHATQIPPTSWLFTIAGSFASEFMGMEHYRLAAGEKGPGSGPYGWEDDLFAGLDLPATAPVSA
jgi:N-acetyl-1-D-myo-inositol-2-amino-2-deoxy-alpha-D-glucopyranoside deacetylase